MKPVRVAGSVVRRRPAQPDVVKAKGVLIGDTVLRKAGDVIPEYSARSWSCATAPSAVMPLNCPRYGTLLAPAKGATSVAMPQPM
jgi:NAD-dependent DNA ligase